MQLVETAFSNPEQVEKPKDRAHSVALGVIGIGFGVTLAWISFLGWVLLHVFGGLLALIGF